MTEPKALSIDCPDCGEQSLAVVPSDAELVNEDEEGIDGKVWVNCYSCDDQFLAFYRSRD